MTFELIASPTFLEGRTSPLITLQGPHQVAEAIIMINLFSILAFCIASTRDIFSVFTCAIAVNGNKASR